MAIPGLRVDFVPPAEPHETTAGDILEVVEVGGEEEDGDDEDEDEVGGEEEAEQVDEQAGDAEGEEGEEGDGVSAEAETEGARGWILHGVYYGFVS